MSGITVLYSVFPLPGMIYAFAAIKLGRHCDPWPSGDLRVCHAMTKIHGPVIAANTPNLRHRKTHIKYRFDIYICVYTSHQQQSLFCVFTYLLQAEISKHLGQNNLKPSKSIRHLKHFDIKSKVSLSFIKSLDFCNFTLIHTLRFPQSFWMVELTLEVQRGFDVMVIIDIRWSTHLNNTQYNKINCIIMKLASENHHVMRQSFNLFFLCADIVLIDRILFLIKSNWGTGSKYERRSWAEHKRSKRLVIKCEVWNGGVRPNSN